jgi:hypothetical protein
MGIVIVSVIIKITSTKGIRVRFMEDIFYEVYDDNNNGAHNHPKRSN